MDNKAKIFYVLDQLEAIYHNEARSPELGHPEPLDGLILTILSQNTNDRNRDSAFASLKAKFPAWQDVIEAGSEGLEAVIRSAGLAHTKAQRIITILSKIHADFGEYSIIKLARRNPGEIASYLREFPGVGAKTAACVLLFDLKLKAFPVDTHIARVSKRIGFVPEKFSAEEISQVLEEIVPAERCLGGHVNIIAHGRAVCHSRKPECRICTLSSICEGARCFTPSRA